MNSEKTKYRQMFGREPDFKNAFYSDLKYLYTFYVSFFFFFFQRPSNGDPDASRLSDLGKSPAGTSFHREPRRLTPFAVLTNRRLESPSIGESLVETSHSDDFELPWTTQGEKLPVRRRSVNPRRNWTQYPPSACRIMGLLE